jgi:hypothetical protein
MHRPALARGKPALVRPDRFTWRFAKSVTRQGGVVRIPAAAGTPFIGLRAALCMPNGVTTFASNGEMQSWGGIDLGGQFTMGILARSQRALPELSPMRRTQDPIADTRGQPLQAGETYKLRVPKETPAREFWSLTIYERATCVVAILGQHARYHAERNQRGLKNRLIYWPMVAIAKSGAGQRHARLGGTLNFYHRRAA